MSAMQADAPLLRVRELEVRLGRILAVDGVSFDVAAGEVLGIVGESGAGKSMAARAIAGLAPPRAMVRGSVRLAGEEILGASPASLRRILGRRIGYVFQDATAALDPVYTIGEQMTEVIRVHAGASPRAARSLAEARLDEVRIRAPRDVLDAYPHQLSGGMRQRVMIAIALLGDPEIVMADEPTSALDLTVQRRVLEVLLEVCDRRRAAVLLITHDLGVVAQTCDRVVVLYGGRVAEVADTRAVFARPLHPYTGALLGSVLRFGEHRPFEPIPGQAIRVIDAATRCPFSPRCAMAIPACEAGVPPLRAHGERLTSCLRAEEVRAG
ncbi:MAG: ABC transporter ATP-binding protein [Variibacter sp.]|nr:ABC transporter ATP-binding protein [Variibacter sp.]